MTTLKVLLNKILTSKNLCVIPFLLTGVCNNLYSQQEDTTPITFEASYISDYVNNISGGINQASLYLGMIDISATFNTQDLGLWKNGELYVQVENTHGGTPSEDLVGDFQTLSNIENSDFTYLYQFWYRQTFNKISIIFGVHDLNSEFLSSEYGGEFVNSSFGIMPAVSMNVPVSIFPKICLGVITKLSVTRQLDFLFGVYDGDPMDLDQDRYNTNFSIGPDEGFFSIFETHYSLLNDVDDLIGTYKLGAFYHSGEFTDLSDSSNTIRGNYGLYLIADQNILSWRDSKKLNAFIKFGIAPQNRSFNKLFWALGLSYYSPLRNRENDIVGLALANALVSDYLVNNTIGGFKKQELAIEFMYKANINENISVQPEIQYIVNPGASKEYKNAFVGLLRTSISF